VVNALKLNEIGDGRMHVTLILPQPLWPSRSADPLILDGPGKPGNATQRHEHLAKSG